MQDLGSKIRETLRCGNANLGGRSVSEFEERLQISLLDIVFPDRFSMDAEEVDEDDPQNEHSDIFVHIRERSRRSD